jgi:hypothetical protein
VRIVVTEVTGQGSVRRGVLDTARHSDPERCKDLVQQADLDAPPPYRPEVGRPVYEICVDDKIFWVAWRDLAGPLRELVTMTILAGQPGPGHAAAGGRQQTAQPPADSPEDPVRGARTLGSPDRDQLPANFRGRPSDRPACRSAETSGSGSAA